MSARNPLIEVKGKEITIWTNSYGERGPEPVVVNVEVQSPTEVMVVVNDPYNKKEGGHTMTHGKPRKRRKT